jgi:hypothetical protein
MSRFAGMSFWEAGDEVNRLLAAGSLTPDELIEIAEELRPMLAAEQATLDEGLKVAILGYSAAQRAIDTARASMDFAVSVAERAKANPANVVAFRAVAPDGD